MGGEIARECFLDRAQSGKELVALFGDGVAEAQPSATVAMQA